MEYLSQTVLSLLKVSQYCAFLRLSTSLYSSAAFFTIMLDMPSPTAGGAGAGVLGSSVPLLMRSARCFSSAAILLLMADWSSRYNSMALWGEKIGMDGTGWDRI